MFIKNTTNTLQNKNGFIYNSFKTLVCLSVLIFLLKANYLICIANILIVTIHVILQNSMRLTQNTSANAAYRLVPFFFRHLARRNIQGTARGKIAESRWP